MFLCDEYIGLEIDTCENRKFKKADFFYDGVHMPFESESFDSVFSSQVLEYVFNPGVYLQEIRRILKKDGMALLAVPFAWEEHEKPIDYGRYSSFGLRHLLRNNGFEVVKQVKSSNTIEVLFQFFNNYCSKRIRSKYLYFINLCIIGPVNISGLILSKMLPKDDDLCLDNMILVKKSGCLILT